MRTLFLSAIRRNLCAYFGLCAGLSDSSGAGNGQAWLSLTPSLTKPRASVAQGALLQLSRVPSLRSLDDSPGFKELQLTDGGM